MSGKHRGRRIIALLVAVNVLLLCAAVYVVKAYFSAQETPQDAPMEQEQLVQVAHGMTGVTYNPEPFMKNGKIAVMLSNGSETGSSVRVELILLTDNTQLARTDLIDAGYRLEYLTAQRSLKKGEYPCLLRVELCTPEGETIGTAGRSLLLKVE